MKSLVCALGALVMAGGASAPAHGAEAPAYREVGSVALGAPERWDYVVADPVGARVYVAHGDRVTVVDSHALQRVGEVLLPGAVTHGVYIAVESGVGITDDSEAGKAIAFDLKTLAVRATLPAAKDADAVAGEGRRAYVIAGDAGVVSAVDATALRTVGTIQVGGKLEYAQLDGRGHLFVNGADRKELVRIDTASNAVTARWPIADCESPHGLAIDPAGRRLFVTCLNGRMDVVDSESGREVTSLPIGLGSDAAVFDPVRRRVLSSNGKEGAISVFQEVDPNTFRPMASIPTAPGARTMALDPSDGRLYVASADVDPAGPVTGRRRFLPGTLKLLVFAPAS